MFWQPPERDFRKIVQRHDFWADSKTLAMIHKHFGNYMWPIQPANDRDQFWRR